MHKYNTNKGDKSYYAGLPVSNYIQAVSGTIVNQSFDPVSGSFTLVFSASSALAQAKVPTTIYLNEKLYYTNGYSIR